jgi:AcrR family transcriptional regulator
LRSGCQHGRANQVSSHYITLWHEMRHLVYYRDVTSSPSRDKLLAGARRALEQHSSPTMVELAAAAGVSMRQLYRLFGSRDNLLRELDQALPTGTRERIREAAFEQLGSSGLADLSMEEVAARADVSRATLYRLFPGKPALFRELIAAYSPWEPIAQVLEESDVNAPPDELIPRVAHALSAALADRSAVLLRMVLEMSRGDPDTADGVQRSMQRGLPDLMRYLSEQMATGRLRQMHPVMAVQLLAGPIVTHEMTRPLAALVGFETTREAVAAQVAEAWLRAMLPESDA